MTTTIGAVGVTPAAAMDSFSVQESRLISGSVGSVVTALVVHPLEVIKVRLQTASQVATVRASPSSSLCIDASCPARFRAHPVYQQSIQQMARQILVESNGRVFGGLYAGIRPTLLMAVPSTSIYFTLYEEILDKAQSQQQPLWWVPLLAGGTARLVTSFLTSPLEYLRTRAATGGSTSKSSVTSEIHRIVTKEGGLPALFRGLQPTLARDVPFSAIYWCTIEQLRPMWGRSHDRIIPIPQLLGQEFVNGAVGGMVAAALTTPFDVVKTRQQTVSTTSSSLQTVASQQATLWGQLCAIVQKEGIAALWAGNATRMLKVVPSCAIMISSYELGKRVLSPTAFYSARE
jgi:solute carrier family 25, member 39/40